MLIKAHRGSRSVDFQGWWLAGGGVRCCLDTLSGDLKDSGGLA